MPCPYGCRREPVKLESVYKLKRGAVDTTHSQPPRSGKNKQRKESSHCDPVSLIGCANEVPLVVDGVESLGLLDTGSQLTTVAHWFCQKHLENPYPKQ